MLDAGTCEAVAGPHSPERLIRAPQTTLFAVDRTPPVERGLAMGTISGAWDLGVVIGSTVVGFVVERAGFAPGFATGVAGVAAGLALFLVLERRRT